MVSCQMEAVYRQRWMYFCTLTACCSNLSMSITASWTSPTLAALLHDKSSGVSPREAALLSVLLPGGALVGGFVGWALTDWRGRRSANFAGGVLFLTSWLILGISPHFPMMYVARFIAGLAVGILYLSSGIYIAEVSPSSVRQVMFAISQLFTNLGFLIEYLVGPYVSYRSLIVISIIPALVYTACVLFTQESPYYLTSKGRTEEAKETLERLRGVKDVALELKAIQEAVGQTGRGKWEVLLSEQNRRALWVASGAMVVKQMTGGWALVSYAEPLLEETGVPPELGSAILGTAKLFTSVVTIFLTIYFGIKKLVNISLAGISASLMTLLVVLVLQQNTNINKLSALITWLPLIALIVFFVFTDFGIGPFPSFVGAELFSQDVKGLGTLVALSVGHVFGFATMALLTSASLTSSLSLFAASSLLSLPLVNRYLIDTSGKSLSELQLPQHDLQHHL